MRPELRWRNALLRAALTAIEEELAHDLAPFTKQVHEWLAQLQTETDTAFRLCFRLEAPETTVSRRDAHAWSLRYLLQATDDLSLLVPADQVWLAHGKTLPHPGPPLRPAAGSGHAGPGLGKAPRLFIHRGEPGTPPPQEAASLTTDNAYTFFRGDVAVVGGERLRRVWCRSGGAAAGPPTR